jgi:hypothetical protein
MIEVRNEVNYTSTNDMILKKAIYGLVRAARALWKWFKEFIVTSDY